MTRKPSPSPAPAAEAAARAGPWDVRSSLSLGRSQPVRTARRTRNSMPHAAASESIISGSGLGSVRPRSASLSVAHPGSVLVVPGHHDLDSVPGNAAAATVALQCHGLGYIRAWMVTLTVTEHGAAAAALLRTQNVKLRSGAVVTQPLPCRKLRPFRATPGRGRGCRRTESRRRGGPVRIAGSESQCCGHKIQTAAQEDCELMSLRTVHEFKMILKHQRIKNPNAVYAQST